MNIFFSHPTCDLSGLVDKALEDMASRKIGVHMRLGGAKLHDPNFYAGEDHLTMIVECFVAEAVHICGSDCSIFLACDNEQAQDLFLSAMAEHSVHATHINGSILHLQNNQGSASQHLKTFADWSALTKMTRILASRSGFSETAAWFSDIPARQLVRGKASTCLFSDSVEMPDGTYI